jgi:protein TonB
MRSFFLRMKAECSRHRGELLSIVTHLSLLLFLVGGIGRSVHVMPYRLPGTPQGDTLSLSYLPGSFQPVASQTPAKSPKKAKPLPALQNAQKAIDPAPPQAAEAKAGVGSSADSGLGEGDITIAILSYFPHPVPDLSSLPHGTKGDVILDAVIDEHGNISTLTLLKGLGSPVDETVIATVQQWHYTPAMKNGVPVVSEQELHFHYERS